MNDQIDFSFFMSHDPIENPCCVVMDGECKDITWDELFDAEQFDTMECVTYVSSGSFYEKTAGKFRQVKIILGIEKSDVARSFGESIRARLNDDGSQMFLKLSDEAKEKILNHEMELRYSAAHTIIHSKFYLLSHSVTGKHRLIIGSANLTESAFSNGISQYEEVQVYHDETWYSLYQRRFEAIYRKTVDYIPEETLQTFREGKLISVADFTAEEKTEKIIETMKREHIIPLLNEGILQRQQEIQDETVKETTEYRSTFEVISLVSKKDRKTGGYVIKTPKELEGTRTKIIDILFRGTKKEQELARFALNYNEADKKQYRVYALQEGEQASRKAEIYDRRASADEIKASLENVGRFIEAYRNFVNVPDPENENVSHIFETILYAFSSAYIFKLRQETSSSHKIDIPIMLIIGGRASSGKSSLLAYLDALLSGRHLSREDHYLQYEKLTGKRTLESLFYSENTYPLLVDEVAPGFFNSKSAGKGEAFIKFLANTLEGKHPAMICTTNTDTFHIPAQVERRIYYVQVDACFDDERKGEATAYYESVLASASNILFRDFCYRMGEKIAHGEDLFGEGEFDYLFCARSIFSDYYRESQMEIPDYMPKRLFRDYKKRGLEMWKVLFQQNSGSFTYRETGKTEKPELVVNLKEIATVRDVNVYMNYLRPDLLVEAAGIYTILRADPFFEWIGVENPWGKKTWFEKLMGKK